MVLAAPTELIQEVTKEQRYLVVLEQVSDLVDWNTIRMYLPNNKKGSRIVVSTQNLHNAILCTRVPYLVTELRWFNDGRPSICAFYEKVAGRGVSDMDTLLQKIGKIKGGGVVSVYGDGSRKSSVVKRLCLRIKQNPGLVNGMKFKACRWVPVGRRPFSLVDFSRRLVLDLSYYGFYDGDLQELYNFAGSDQVWEVLYGESEEEFIQWSHKFLHKSQDCLVVIDGLRSKKGWDDARKCTKLPGVCCVIVVTNKERVARYCTDDNEDLLVHITEGVQVGLQQHPVSTTTTCTREKAISSLRRGSHPYHTQKLSIFNCDIISHPVVSVWGVAGVGKTSLVRWYYNRKMFDDPENSMDKYRYFCWVDVPHPFSLAELSVRLLSAFFSDYPSQDKERELIHILEGDRNPIQECRMLLRQRKQRRLLVLDGLRSTDDWDSINEAFCLSQPRPGYKIIVVTNEQNVAMHCAKEKKEVISVRGLEFDEALDYFNKQIDDIRCEDMRGSELSKSIIAKSGGLPKIVDVVADHYNTHIFEDEPRLKLKNINDNFMQILEGSDSLRGLFSWMQSYLETCKDDLKPCIFYLPVFPLGHEIRYSRLRRRLIAEGYFRDTAEKNTERLFTELMDSCMFQLQESSKPVQCRLNGFLHEYINSRPMEGNLVFALEGSCSMGSQRTGGQHLTIRKNWDRDMNVFWSTDFSRLRSLTVFGECKPFMFDPKKIKMRHVRVLDLEDASGLTNDDLKLIVEVFPRLKFLSLRGCRVITYLPESLCRLRQLQTLDVRHTSIDTLPEAILKLQKLQYVRAGTIHSAPWDEGTMVPYQAETREETSVPAEDGTTFAAAPSAPTEDGSTPCATAEDNTIIQTPPVAEVATTNAAVPSAPAEDASTPSATASNSEDTTIIFDIPPVSSSEVATTDAAAPSAPEEDASTPSATTSDSEDSTIFEIHVSRIVAGARSALAENVATLPAVPPAPAEDSSTAAAAPRSRTHALVPSWLSKLGYRSHRRLHNTNHGVQVPAGIGKLTTLHTFGVANVGTPNKAVIVKELSELTQLRRLGVCGINVDNISDFFSAISGLKHLEELSVGLDMNKDGLFPSLDGTIARPPETLRRSLKLHGHVRILPDSWINEFADVEKFDIEVSLQEQNDMQVILGHLNRGDIRSWFKKRLCIKPIQDGDLRIGINGIEERCLDIEVLEIVCTTKLKVTIGKYIDVRVLRVHCSTRSSLQLSGLQEIRSLKEVWLKGSRIHALKQDLQSQLAKREVEDEDEDKPVLKVFQPRSP